nr:MAG TPA: hypothetical protein [Caudoviricetes sp.]
MYIAVLVCVSFVTGNSLYLHQCSLRHKYSKVFVSEFRFSPKRWETVNPIFLR